MSKLAETRLCIAQGSSKGAEEAGKAGKKERRVEGAREGQEEREEGQQTLNEE